MSESQGWRDLADSLFSAGGDVVKDATVFVESETPVYDSDTGQFSKSTSETETKLLWEKGKSYFNNIELVKEGDRVCMVRGSDFSSPPSPGNKVSVSGETTTYRVEQVGFMDAGTGAMYYLHLRKGGVINNA